MWCQHCETQYQTTQKHSNNLHKVSQTADAQQHNFCSNADSCQRFRLAAALARISMRVATTSRSASHSVVHRRASASRSRLACSTPHHAAAHACISMRDISMRVAVSSRSASIVLRELSSRRRTAICMRRSVLRRRSTVRSRLVPAGAVTGLSHTYASAAGRAARAGLAGPAALRRVDQKHSSPHTCLLCAAYCRSKEVQGRLSLISLTWCETRASNAPLSSRLSCASSSRHRLRVSPGTQCHRQTGSELKELRTTSFAAVYCLSPPVRQQSTGNCAQMGRQLPHAFAAAPAPTPSRRLPAAHLVKLEVIAACIPTPVLYLEEHAHISSSISSDSSASSACGERATVSLRLAKPSPKGFEVIRTFPAAPAPIPWPAAPAGSARRCRMSRRGVPPPASPAHRLLPGAPPPPAPSSPSPRRALYRAA